MMSTHARSLCLAATLPGGHWTPGIGDPTVVGWVTVAAYFFAAWLCFRCARRASARARSGDATIRPRFCWMVAFAMLALGVNKQLDLQTLLTDIARTMAKSEGWYERRQLVQTAFIAAVATLGLVTIAGAAWILRRDFGRGRLMWAGLLFLACFVVVRATSFHHVDRMLGCEIGDFITINALLELSGIACVGVGAMRYVRANRPTHAAPPKPLSPASRRRAEAIWQACQRLSPPPSHGSRGPTC